MTKYNDTITAIHSADEQPELRLETTFDPESEPVSSTVVQTVASLAGVEPTGLSPLAHSIDPEALDTLVSTHATNRRRSGPLRVSFRYADLIVEIENGETIRLYPEDIPD